MLTKLLLFDCIVVNLILAIAGYKVYNFIQNANKWYKHNGVMLERLRRSLSKPQQVIYDEAVCQKCNDILPINTARTHDGLRLCVNCKQLPR